jgi:hypothetical protein
VAEPAQGHAELASSRHCRCDGRLGGADVARDGEILGRIDEIVPPRTDVGPLHMSCPPPALERVSLRRRPADERAAA